MKYTGEFKQAHMDKACPDVHRARVVQIHHEVKLASINVK
jgi:hypothetical protein